MSRVIDPTSQETITESGSSIKIHGVPIKIGRLGGLTHTLPQNGHKMEQLGICGELADILSLITGPYVAEVNKTAIITLMATFSQLHPDLRQAILSAPAHLRDVLAATAMVENRGRLSVPGGGDSGNSYGPYMENSRGRGAGIAIASRRDPVASTQRAVNEFQTFYDRGYRGAELAYQAQRPADRNDYIQKINAQLGTAGAALDGMPAADTQQLAGRLDDIVENRNDYSTSARLTQALANRDEGSSLSQTVLKMMQEKKADEERIGMGPIDQPPQIEEEQGNVQLLSSGGGKFTAGGGPEDHGARALGNWQSDNAYDVMGQTGQSVVLPFGGRVVNISGQPGGNPQFAGYGVTIEDASGDQWFFKHLGSIGQFQVGDSLQAGTVLGGLDGATRGGPHLHLGGTNRSRLDEVYRYYVG